MSNYETMVRRQRVWMLILLAFIALVAIVLPYKDFLIGLLIGTIISFYNMWLLQRRAALLGEAAAREGKRKGIGTISRLAAAALGVLLVIRYDYSIVGFVIGLMTVYPVIMIQFFFTNKR